MRSYTGIVLALALAIAPGCKKKPADGGEAPKPTEGSGSAVTTTTGSGSAPTPATGSGSADVATGSGSATAETKSIIDTAKAAGNFTTLVKAIEAAGLGEKLSGAGPFTVFAPTDEAFAKVPAKDLEALLADKAKLAAVLEYHVVAGNVASKDLATQKAAKPISGPDLVVDATSGVKVGGATVVKADVVASNGVIHAIDTVLLPPAK